MFSCDQESINSVIFSHGQYTGRNFQDLPERFELLTKGSSQYYCQGRWHYLEKLGEGAYAEVYRALDMRMFRETGIQKIVAIKVLKGYDYYTMCAAVQNGHVSPHQSLSKPDVRKSYMADREYRESLKVQQATHGQAHCPFVRYLENHTGLQDMTEEFLDRFACETFTWDDVQNPDILTLRREMSRKGYLVMEYVPGVMLATLIQASCIFQDLMKNYIAALQKELRAYAKSKNGIIDLKQLGILMGPERAIKTLRNAVEVNLSDNKQLYECTHEMLKQYSHPDMSSTLNKYISEGRVDAIDLTQVDTSSSQKYFSDEDRRSIAMQGAQILLCLKRSNVIHRDFRVHNLMYNPVAGQLTLLDFGLLIENRECFHSTENKCFRTYWKPETYWIPPEVKDVSLHGVCNFSLVNPFSFDMFSYGVMVLELVVTRSDAYFEMLKKVRNLDKSDNESSHRTGEMNNMAHRIMQAYINEEDLFKLLRVEKKFLLATTHPDARRRPTPQEVLQHISSGTIDNLPQKIGQLSQVSPADLSFSQKFGESGRNAANLNMAEKMRKMKNAANLNMTIRTSRKKCGKSKHGGK